MNAAISVNKPAVMSSAVGRSLTNALFPMSGNAFIGPTFMSVPFAANTPVPLGGVTAPHWSWFINLDPTNFLRLSNGIAGAKVVKLKPGEFALFPWDDGATPYAQADTAAVLMEYTIFSL